MPLNAVQLILTLVALVGSTGSAVASLAVAPQTEGSHEAYIEWIDGERGRRVEEILAEYERYIAAHPTDVQAAVERCRFLAMAEYDDWEEENPRQEEFERRLEEAEARFPNEPAVLMLKLDHLWAEEAVAFYEGRIAPLEARFSDQQLAEVHQRIYWALPSGKEFEDQEGLHALRAMELDPSLDLNQVVAEYEWRQGHRERAIEYARREVERASYAWEIRDPVKLFLEMEEFDEALRALDAQAALDPSAVRPELLARALVGEGETERARAAYREACEKQDFDLCAEYFEFELEHGDAANASVAYDRLLDAADDEPRLFLTERLRLSGAYPGVPWGRREMPIFMVGFIVLALILVAPLGLLVPIHYGALLRRARGAAPAAPTLWGLRHVWFLTSGFLLASLVSVLVFYPGEFANWFANSMRGELDIPDRALVAQGWFNLITFLAALVAIVRPRQLAALLRNRWTRRRSILVVLGWPLLSVGFGFLVSLLLGEQEQPPLIEQWIRAVVGAYGGIVLVLVVAGVTPVFEELAFRGVFLDGLRRHLPFWIANAVQALAFALGHGQFLLLPFFFAFGFALGEIRRRSGGVVMPIALHAVHNFVLTVPLLLEFGP